LCEPEALCHFGWNGPTAMDDIEGLRRILKENRTIAVVGLSAQWFRPSFFAAKYLQEHGYRVIPVNPAYREVLGETCYPSLLEVPDQIDVVDVFRKPQDVPPIADDAVRIGAKVLWLQIGVIHEAAARQAREAGLEVVMDRCMKIEHARLYGGLGFVGVYTGVISSKRPRWLPF
jgi:predicted CoA-binding protein